MLQNCSCYVAAATGYSKNGSADRFAPVCLLDSLSCRGQELEQAQRQAAHLQQHAEQATAGRAAAEAAAAAAAAELAALQERLASADAMLVRM